LEAVKLERTLSIVKPDGVRTNLIGEVLNRFENADLRLIGLKMIKLSKKQAEGFYAVHKDRPFFSSLTDFMSSGPCVVILLEGENAINKLREMMGATNPEEALKGTIRSDYASNIEQNVVHGSDSPESALFEIKFFFNDLEICERES
jgi:nucleoside-diphosphate kinase